MKKSEFTFAEGFLAAPKQEALINGNELMAFDWDKAAKIIKDKLVEHHGLIAEAGLQRDWEYTGGIIFENGKPTNDNYTYLASIWAKPTLLLFWDDEEQEEIVCEIVSDERFKSSSKWDDVSLNILGLQLSS